MSRTAQNEEVHLVQQFQTLVVCLLTLWQRSTLWREHGMKEGVLLTAQSKGEKNGDLLSLHKALLKVWPPPSGAIG